MISSMITIDAIHVAPVKSLGLVSPETVQVALTGIVEDRRFFLVSGNGRLVTQRELGKLVQLKAEYQAQPELLRLEFPDGQVLQGTPEPGEPVATPMWGRLVRGRLLTGDWSDALSRFCGGAVGLAQADQPGQCYDEFPISLTSRGSLQHLGSQTVDAHAFDSRRFRPNFLLDGCQPHEEDTWLGRAIQVGPDLRLRLIAQDPRCAITTHDPDTGAPDIDTLRIILSYRPSPVAAYFGVYAIVERPGSVSVGDLVEVVD